MLIQNIEELEKFDELKNRPQKKYIGYYRMGYRHGYFGVWIEKNEELTESENSNIVQTIEYIEKIFPKGMNWEGEEFVKETLKPSPNGRYYTFAANTNFNILVEISTEFGNGDYPFRIYFYRDLD